MEGPVVSCAREGLRRVGTGNFRLGQLTAQWSEHLQTSQMCSLEQGVLVQSSYQDHTSHISPRGIEDKGIGGFVCCFPVVELGTGAGNRAVGRKNVCLKGSKESLHFTRSYSIDLKFGQL